MSAATTTITGGGPIAALVEYYDRLEADPDRDVVPFGFSRQRVTFCVVLEPDGALSAVQDMNRQEGKKTLATMMVLPGQSKPSGQGINPCFLWDNTGYMLGFKPDDPKPERTQTAFQAFRDRHVSLAKEIADEGFDAVCRFLQSWEPARAGEHPILADVATGFGVFKLRGEPGYIHHRKGPRDYWRGQIAAAARAEGAVEGRSLLSGEPEPIANIHEPKIKGVADAQSSGALLVSFNERSYESYGKTQSYNAPVGVSDTFKYANALNGLLADSARRARIGDATVVFWAASPAADPAADLFASLLTEEAAKSKPGEDAKKIDQLRAFLDLARQGRMVADVDPDTPFYVLGLSPNASRISVRFWLSGTVGQFARRLARHAADLEMVGQRETDPPLMIRGLLIETAREAKDIPPQLGGGVARAVLEGTSYPRALFGAVIRRIRVEAEINYPKAAILKACLIRSGATTMDASLNKRHPDPAYHCGRMFAMLAFAQDESLKKVNAGIVRRNMGAAMATPGLVLGRLQRAAEVGHIPKLDGDLPQFVRDEMQAICVALGDRIPVQLDLTRQGIFGLGYYQQRAYLDGISGAVKGHKCRRSEQGEWMRSVLEVRVADALARAGIRYVYEVRSVLKSGQERWPDFFVEGGRPEQDVYLEVLGYKSAEYDDRWDAKIIAYRELGITPQGGSRGRLAVLDWREKWGKEPETKPVYPSDREVLDVLRPHLPLPEAADFNDINHEGNVTDE